MSNPPAPWRAVPAFRPRCRATARTRRRRAGWCRERSVIAETSNAPFAAGSAAAECATRRRGEATSIDSSHACGAGLPPRAALLREGGRHRIVAADAARRCRRIREATMRSRRDALKLFGACALGALAPHAFRAAHAQNEPITMDGHAHIINRVYWEGIDAWQEQPGIGWDYARARKAGVNCVIDNIGTYGAWNYNYSP